MQVDDASLTSHWQLNTANFHSMSHSKQANTSHACSSHSLKVSAPPNDNRHILPVALGVCVHVCVDLKYILLFGSFRHGRGGHHTYRDEWKGGLPSLLPNIIQRSGLIHRRGTFQHQN